MPQPELIQITDWLRLRRYDGNFALFLPGYRDPVVYQNSEGIFDESRVPDLAYVERMCNFLDQKGSLFYIEVGKKDRFEPIGDVTILSKNPPIAIWKPEYRGKGIGTLVMQTVIRCLRDQGFDKITGSTVYKWNTASQKLHEKLGFVRVREDGDEIIYELKL